MSTRPTRPVPGNRRYERLDDLIARIRDAERSLARVGIYPSNVRVADRIGKSKGAVAYARVKHDPRWAYRFASFRSPNRVARREPDDDHGLSPGDVEASIFLIRREKERRYVKPVMTAGDVAARMIREHRKGTGWRWLARVNNERWAS